MKQGVLSRRVGSLTGKWRLLHTQLLRLDHAIAGKESGAYLAISFYFGGHNMTYVNQGLIFTPDDITALP